MKYIFGPVNSRRLGISLGIDLVPFKTCSLDCVYCESGKTTVKTSEIDEYVPADLVIAELKEYLKVKPSLDTITFSGSGEPTLHSGIGTIIGFLKQNYPEYKIAVLTNGTLFKNESVRRSVLNADIIIPSLDAASEVVFQKISRPCSEMNISEIIKGLILLRKEYKNTLILEIFIVPSLNDGREELELLKSACMKIMPDRIQLNNLDRPGTEKWIKPASYERLFEIQEFFKPINAEIISAPEKHKNSMIQNTQDIENRLLSLIKRRPSTYEDICSALVIDQTDLEIILKKLTEKGVIQEEKRERGIFFILKKIN